MSQYVLENATSIKSRRHRSGAFLSFDRAVDAMHRCDARMVQMVLRDGPAWFVLPQGGRVHPVVADQIVRRPDVIAGPDPVFPRLPCTWRCASI